MMQALRNENPAIDDNDSFLRQLVEDGLIIPTAVPGTFGRAAVFEEVLNRFNDLVTRVSAHEPAEFCTFPPVIDRAIIERVDYLDWFPHLCGSVHSFCGDAHEARALSDNVHANAPYAQLMDATRVVLNPAACYPLYPTLSGTLPAAGKLVTMVNWVFRHEPSHEPTRMQSFRVREFVRLGQPEDVAAWRDGWAERALTLLRDDLQLPATLDTASDPFFGTAGTAMADSQKSQKLKYEVLVPVISDAKPTAVCSFNLHRDHFGDVFEIRLPGGEPAHSACLGFGLERVTMALFKAHGSNPRDWPAPVRQQFWP